MRYINSIFLIFITIFLIACSEVDETSFSYIIVNETSHSIAVEKYAFGYGEGDTLKLYPNSRKEAVDSDKGCYSTYNEAYYSAVSVRVVYDDSISIFHYSADSVEGASNSIMQDEDWKLTCEKECYFQNTFTFTEADYQEALANQ